MWIPGSRPVAFFRETAVRTGICQVVVTHDLLDAVAGLALLLLAGAVQALTIAAGAPVHLMLGGNIVGSTSTV